MWCLLDDVNEDRRYKCPFEISDLSAWSLVSGHAEQRNDTHLPSLGTWNAEKKKEKLGILVDKTADVYVTALDVELIPLVHCTRMICRHLLLAQRRPLARFPLWRNTSVLILEF